MSLFVAIVPPIDVVEDLHDVITDVRRMPGQDTVRWTSLNRWHITLGFLGDPDDHVDEEVAERLNAVASEPIIPGARLTGAGSFGRAVLWVGLEEGPALDRLAGIARSIPRLVRGSGADPDRRPWRPHLTVARLRGGSPGILLGALSAYRGPDWAVRELHLIRSTGGPNPHHRRVATVTLAET